MGRCWLPVLRDGPSIGLICEGAGGASLSTTFGDSSGGNTLGAADAIRAERRSGANLGGGGGRGVRGAGCSVALRGRENCDFRVRLWGGIYGLTGRDRRGAGVAVMRMLLTEVVR